MERHIQLLLDGQKSGFGLFSYPDFADQAQGCPTDTPRLLWLHNVNNLLPFACSFLYPCTTISLSQSSRHLHHTTVSPSILILRHSYANLIFVTTNKVILALCSVIDMITQALLALQAFANPKVPSSLLISCEVWMFFT